MECSYGQPIHDWSVRVGDAQFGLVEWSKGTSTIYVYREIGRLPLGASGIVSIELLALALVVFVYFRVRGVRG
jgi:hypothetical protein